MQSKEGFSRIVVKVGSSLLSSKDGSISLKYLENIAEQISQLMAAGFEIILVSSGAIACGMSILQLKKRPNDMAKLQAAAAIGQSELMDIYRRLFGKNKYICGQILLTWEDFENRQRYLNVKNTLMTLVRNKALPIVNENDTVSTAEIRFGDNDKLSALVSNLIDADLLVILSDVDGLYRWPEKEVISIVERITPEIERFCCSTDKQACVGGMSSKIEAVKALISSGIPCIIANGKSQDMLLKAARGERVGTLFVAKGSFELQAKKRWIAYGVRPRGVIIVDDGAKDALINRRKSLLAPGIIEVRNNFKKSDVVSVADSSQKEFARGIVNFSAHDLESQKRITPRQEVIHRDSMVILEGH